MTQYRILYPNGEQSTVSRIRDGQHRWRWYDLEGHAVLSTHLDVAQAYAKEVGGKFVSTRTAKPVRSGHPTALANLLNGR